MYININPQNIFQSHLSELVYAFLHPYSLQINTLFNLKN